MKQLRTNLVFLVAYFFLLFLLLYGGIVFRYELISVFVVLLISMMVSIGLLAPKIINLSRYMTWLITYTFYLIWLLLNSDFQPVNNFQSVYRIFTEMFMITIGLNLSWQISKFLDETQNILRQITFSTLKPAMQLDVLENEIEKEIDRARRYERPLALLVVDATTRLNVETRGDRIHQLQAEMLDNYFEARVGHEIQKLIRSTDIVAKADPLGRFFVICPETSLRSVEYLGERISVVIDEKLDAVVNWGVTEVNEEIPTFAKACEVVERDLMNRSMNNGVRFKGESDLANFLAEYQVDESEKEAQSEE